jgi:hypothetical protein
LAPTVSGNIGTVKGESLQFSRDIVYRKKLIVWELKKNYELVKNESNGRKKGLHTIVAKWRVYGE